MHKVSKRLLIVSHVLVRSHNGRHYLQGGFGRHVDAFARRFDEVWLLSCVEPANGLLDEYYLRAPNVKLIAVPDIWHPVRAVRYALRIRGMLCAAVMLPSAIKKCDVIHPRLPSPVGAVGALAAKFARKPSFVYVAGDREESLLRQGPLVRSLASVAQRLLRFLVGSNPCFTAGDVLCRKFGGPSEQVIPVVTTAMDRTHLIDPEAALERTRRQPHEILFVGAVGEAKGVDVLLEAVRTMREQGIDVCVRIIGSTHDGAAWLDHQVASLHLEGAVVYQNHMAWDKLICEYDKSDVFALPTMREGVPKVLTEAMARGLPVVASSVGGIPWIVKHGESGLLVRSGAPAELAEALIALFDDVELRKSLVLGGLEVARRHILDDLIDGMVQKICQRYGFSGCGDSGEVDR